MINLSGFSYCALYFGAKNCTLPAKKNFYISDNTEISNNNQNVVSKQKIKNKMKIIKKQELYPKLAECCNAIGIKTLKIDKKKSNKSGGVKYNI